MEALKARDRSFYMTMKEARVMPDVVASVFSIMNFFKLFCYVLMIVFLLGNFLVNSLSVL